MLKANIEKTLKEVVKHESKVVMTYCNFNCDCKNSVNMSEVDAEQIIEIYTKSA